MNIPVSPGVMAQVDYDHPLTPAEWEQFNAVLGAMVSGIVGLPSHGDTGARQTDAAERPPSPVRSGGSASVSGAAVEAPERREAPAPASGFSTEPPGSATPPVVGGKASSVQHKETPE